METNQHLRSENGGLTREQSGKIERLIPDILRWSERAKTSESAEPGSSLKADDFGEVQVEIMVWYFLAVASEHLAFTIDALHKTRTTYPTAYYPAVRTSLVASANALWLLTGKSRGERRLRALKLRVSELKKRQTEWGVKNDGAENEGLQDRLDALFECGAKEFGLDKKAIQKSDSQTEVIKKVAGRVDASLIDEGYSKTRYIWEMGSAAVHAAYDLAVTRVSPEDRLVDTEGRTSFNYWGNHDDLVLAIQCAHSALAAAFQDFERRKVNPFKAM